MNSLPPPKPIEINSSNAAEAWTKWKLRFQIYLEATDLKGKTEKRKVAILLHNIGDEAQTVADTFTYHTTEGQPTANEDITIDMMMMMIWLSNPKVQGRSNNPSPRLPILRHMDPTIPGHPQLPQVHAYIVLPPSPRSP